MTYHQLKDLLKEFSNAQLNQPIIVYDAQSDCMDDGVMPMRRDCVPTSLMLYGLELEDRIEPNQVILLTNIDEETIERANMEEMASAEYDLMVDVAEVASNAT